MIPAAEREQMAFDEKFEEFKKYKPMSDANINEKAITLKNPENLYKGREVIIDAFKNKLFPLTSGNYYEEVREETPESSSPESFSPTIEEEPSGDDRLSTIKEEEALEKIAAIDNILEPGLVKKYFKNDSLTNSFEQLRSLIKNQSKISAKKIKMTLIEAGL